MRNRIGLCVLLTWSLWAGLARAEGEYPSIWPAAIGEAIEVYKDRALFADGQVPKGIDAVLDLHADVAVVRIGQLAGLIAGSTYVLDFADDMAYGLPPVQVVVSARVSPDGQDIAVVMSSPWPRALVTYSLLDGRVRFPAGIEAVPGSVEWIDSDRLEYVPWIEGQAGADPVVVDLSEAPLVARPTGLPLGTEGASTCGGTTSCAGSGNPYPCCSNNGNCTWWAWHKMCGVWGRQPRSWGNANTWYSNAGVDGYYRSGTPAVNTVACRNEGTFGHVAWVVDFNSTQVRVTEQNCDWNPAYRDVWYNRSWFVGYVYKEAPPPPCTGAGVTGHPSSRTQCPGTTATFSVSGSGTGPLSYRWQKNGSDLSNGGHYSNVTGSTLTVSNISSADAASYRCRISNACGTAYSNSANLTVQAATVVNSQLASSFACPGTTLNFTVSCSGTGTLTYQWQKDNVNLPNGGHYSGVTTATLTITNIDTSVEGTYRCVVTGGCGSASSQTTTLAVGSMTQVTTQPLAQAGCAGTSASFSVEAAGTNLTYQWQRDGVDIADGGPYSGVNTATLEITDLEASLAGDYRCVVGGFCGADTSEAVALVVDPLTVIEEQPTDQPTCTGAVATFTAVASGSGEISYQWQKDEVDLIDGGNVSGANTAVLQIADAYVDDVGSYRCVIDAGCGVETTEAAALSLFASTAITVQPESVVAPAGAVAKMSIAAVGADLGFQWFKDDSPLTDNDYVAGTNTPVLVFFDIAGEDVASYTCEANGPCGPELSQPASLTLGWGGVSALGPTYGFGPRDINSGGTRSTADAYALASSVGQAGGVGPIEAAPYGLHDGFWPAAYATVPLVLIPPDFDQDGDVDGVDLAHFIACVTGPALGPPTEGCEDTDFDGDDDSDQADFGIFQGCLTGTNVPSDPSCMP